MTSAPPISAGAPVAQLGANRAPDGDAPGDAQNAFSQILDMLHAQIETPGAAPATPQTQAFDATGVFGLAAPASPSELCAPTGPAALNHAFAAPLLASPTLAQTPAQGRVSPTLGRERPTPVAEGATPVAPAAKLTRPSVDAHALASMRAPSDLKVGEVTMRAAPASAQRMDKRSDPAQASAVFVALQATEQGLCVFARVGRMTTTERERLRHGVRALLAQHGLSPAAIVFDENGPSHAREPDHG